jgi:uncharacterized protein
MITAYGLLFAAAIWAGIQNALAGGGSFIIFPALLMAGLDARGANITSTIALFPAQVVTGWVGRKNAAGVGRLPFRALVAISLAGGALGAVLLLSTPASFFERLVPWLVLLATAIFAWGSVRGSKAGAEIAEAAATRPGAAAVAQSAISIYGGYFGGGIGILMLAALTLSGMPVRVAGASKNLLAAAMNASAVMIFLAIGQVAWREAMILGSGAVLGGWLGGHWLQRVNEKWLRAGVIAIGVLLSIGLFMRAYHG